MQEKLSPVRKIETILDACESEASLTRFSIMADMNLLELALKPMEERTSSSDSWHAHDDFHLRDDVEARRRYGPYDAHRHRPRSILGRHEAILSRGPIPLDCDDREKMYNRKKGESIMKKTLLLAVAAVVGASIVAIAGINANPSLLAPHAEGSVTEKSFSFGRSVGSNYISHFDENEGVYSGSVNTNKSDPIECELDLSTFDAEYRSFGPSKPTSALVLGNMLGGMSDGGYVKIGFTFGINNLTKLNTTCGVTNKTPLGGTANPYRYNVTLKNGDVTVESHTVSLDNGELDEEKDFVWDKLLDSIDPSSIVTSVTIEMFAYDNASSIYIKGISFSWSC